MRIWSVIVLVVLTCGMASSQAPSNFVEHYTFAKHYAWDDSLQQHVFVGCENVNATLRHVQGLTLKMYINGREQYFEIVAVRGATAKVKKGNYTMYLTPIEGGMSVVTQEFDVYMYFFKPQPCREDDTYKKI